MSDFENATEEKWLEKITKDLKGKPLDSLVWKSEIGDINPVIFSTDKCITDSFENKEINHWKIRQSFDASKSNCNQLLLHALKGGVNSIQLLNLSQDNINDVLNNVMLDIIDIHIVLKADNPEATISIFKEYCIKKGISLNDLSGGFDFDPIGNAAKEGNWISSSKETIHSINKVVNSAKEFTNFSVLNIDGSIYSEAGGNIDKQIAFSLLHVNEYLNNWNQAGNNIEELVNKIHFTFGAGTSYFIEIAKIKTFKSLFSLIIEEYLQKEITIQSKIHIKNSNLYYSTKDKYNNLLRATTAGMSSAIAGCDSLTLLPFSYNTDEDESFGLRISKNIQLLLQEESYLGKVTDASKGSYYIESIAYMLKENAWQVFLNIEKNGGFIKALEQDEIQNQLNQDFQIKAENLVQGNKIIVGVNKFLNDEDENVNTLDNVVNEESNSFLKIIERRLALPFESKSSVHH